MYHLINFFLLSIVILFLILSLWDENIVYGALSLSISGVTALFWADSWEIPRAEFVVENASAETIENIGTWVSTNQTYTTAPVTAYIPLIFAIAAFVAMVYAILKNFKSSIGRGW